MILLIQFSNVQSLKSHIIKNVIYIYIMVLRKTRRNKQRKRRRRGRRTRRKRIRKRRTRRRRARSKQRGGMNIRITDKMIANWANPHNLPNDCCPCVFSLLGMPHAIANALATANLRGMGAQQMVQLFSHYYPNYTFTAPAVAVNPGTLSGVLGQVFQVLPAGYATVGGYHRRDGSAHCVIWAKGLNGQPVILDAQAGRIYTGENPILTYLTQQNIASITLIRGVSKTNGTPLSINNQDGHTVQSIQQNHAQNHVNPAQGFVTW